jgi:hypothetical protein
MSDFELLCTKKFLYQRPFPPYSSYHNVKLEENPGLQFSNFFFRYIFNQKVFDYSLRNLEFWVRTLSYKKFLRKFGADRQNWAKSMAKEIQGVLLPRKVKAFGKIETVITNSLMLKNIGKQFPKN